MVQQLDTEKMRRGKAALILTILLCGLLLRCMVTDFTREIASNSDSSAYSYAAKNLLKYGMLTSDRDGTMFAGGGICSPYEEHDAGPADLSRLGLYN